MGGIKAWNLESVTIQLDGTIVFSNNIEEWPKETNGIWVLQCYTIRYI